jgi:hypothetical protein
MMHAGTFGLPQSGELIIVRPGAEPLRLSGYAAFHVRRARASDNEPKLRKLLRELIAMRKAGASRK